MIMIPVCFEEQFLPGTLEYAIHTLIEHEVDMSVFDAKYNNDETGCRAFNPKILLKAVLLGYARRLLSSREIEKACKNVISFMAITCGQAPDHSTIAAFVSSMENEIKLIFRDILLYCDKKGLLGGTCFSIDGCKLPANASKEMSGTFEQLEKKKGRLEKQLEKLFEEHQHNDLTAFEEHQHNDLPTFEEQQHNDLPAKARKLEKKVNTMNNFLKYNEPKSGQKHKENKSNVTDNDSQLMLTSHGVIQGYNAQAFVDSKHQIIVFSDAGSSGQDDEHGSIMIEGAKENLKAIGKDEDCLKNVDVLCDSNYYSPTNFQKLIDLEINGYIPDKDFRKRDPRYTHSDPKFSLTDFDYQPERDVYICPAGAELTRQRDTKRKGKKYYRHYAADEKACLHCQNRHRCLAKKTSKRRWLSVYYDKKLARYARDMIERIDSDEGRKKYDQRFGMVEPVFANIRYQKRMDRFGLRGKKKVDIQWRLYCLVHNIEKCIPFCGNVAFSPAI